MAALASQCILELDWKDGILGDVDFEMFSLTTLQAMRRWRDLRFEQPYMD